MDSKILEIFNVRLNRNKFIKIVVAGGVVFGVAVWFLVKSNADKKAAIDKEFAKEEKPKVEYAIKKNNGEAKDISNYSNSHKINNQGNEIDLSEYEIKKDNLIDEKLSQSNKDKNKNNLNRTEKRIEPKNGDMYSATKSNNTEIDKYNNSVFKKEYIDKNNKLKAENLNLKKDNKKLSVEIDKLKKDLTEKKSDLEKIEKSKKEVEKKLNNYKANESIKETFVLTKELSKQSMNKISFENYDEVKEFISKIEADTYVVLISDEENLISITKNKNEIEYKLYKKSNNDINFDDFFNSVISHLRENKEIKGVEIEILNEEEFLSYIKKSNQLVIERELVYGN